MIILYVHLCTLYYRFIDNFSSNHYANDMDKETALKKIRKCMELSKSSEPYEAAAALRQAQKLIEKFGIDHPEFLASGVSENWGQSTATKTPAVYETKLALMVAEAFGCELLFSKAFDAKKMKVVGGYKFIGIPPAPEISAYTFTVLRRKLTKARAEYIATSLKRYRKNKTAAADTFCLGWVLAVKNAIASCSPNPKTAEAIKAYTEINYKEIPTLKPRHRELENERASKSHLHNGWIDGKNVTINQGVNGQQLTLLE